MGAVTFNIDPKLIAIIHESLPCQYFVETGTFKGATIELVRQSFPEIYSVELSEKHYLDCKEKFKNEPHITLMHNHSPAALNLIMNKIQSESVTYWLDAHWCAAENTQGELSQCPLLEELEAIKKLNTQSMIIIDDARLFLTTPPAPHEVSHWPNFMTIFDKLRELSPVHELTVVNDCILYYPQSIKEAIQKYAYEHGVDWLQTMDKSRDYDKLLQQLYEKEALIQEMAANKLFTHLNEKEKVIQALMQKLAALEQAQSV